MTPEQWQAVLRLFEAASALPEGEREAFLQRECQDQDLRAEVQRLLRVDPTSGTFLEPPPLDEPASGRNLGDFTLLEEIGRGGMGVVYRALQRPLQRIVAVKVLPASFALTPRQIERFEREARAAARLQHPNIVAVLTVGVERGMRYFAMELVDGPNLAEEIKRLLADLGIEVGDRARLPSSRASDFIRVVADKVRQVAEGLEHAHQHGIVHRDVKPSNLLLDHEGHIKLVDFGLARDEELGSLSTSGDVVGTPHYMSPEQARAHRHKIDHRTDIYSLGVVLYELLTLRRPFEGNTSQEVISNLLHKDPPRIRKLNHRVPRDLETICEKALAKSPEERYTSAGELAEDLTRFLHHEAIRAEPPSHWKRLVRHVGRRRNWYLPSAIMTAVLGACVPILVQWTERRELEAQLRPLRGILEREDLDNRPISELVHGLELARELRARGVGTLDVVEPAIRRIEEAGRERKVLGLARLQSGLAPPEGTPLESYHPASDRDYFLGLGLLREALMLLPDDPELKQWSDPRSTYPQLEFLDDPALAGAEVYLQEIDWLTGELSEPSLLGEIPLGGRRPVEQGFYRITVVRSGPEGTDTCEMTRVLDQRGRVYTLRPVLRSSRKVVDGMVLVPAGKYRVGDSDPTRLPVFAALEVELSSFLLDSRETTNGEYRAFLADTGRAPPPHWGADYRSEWDALPVVEVTFEGARAYAEWAGKRLPTRYEWEGAARGAEGWAYPWGNEPGEFAERAVLGRPSRSLSWEEYTASALPPGSRAGDASPSGIFDLLGNVSEWTESIYSSKGDDGEPRTEFGARLIKGAHWGYPVHEPPRLEYVRSCPVVAQEEWLGFRCAKSVWAR